MASWMTKPLSEAEVKIATVVRTAPTSVTNMTGFLIISRGSSLRNESPIAGAMMDLSKSDGVE